MLEGSQSPPFAHVPKRPTIIVGIIVLAYAAARLWRLTDPCLWFDEIFSIHAAEHSWAEIVPFVAKDLIHPPLFYFLLKIWITVGGDSLIWLRLFPVLLSVLALAPLWMLCRELKLHSTTVIVTFGLFAVNGALIKYAQEVRMYSLLMFLSLVSIWLFSRFYFRGKSFWMLVLANVFLVYSHYFGWFLVTSEVVAIAVAQRIKILQTLLMFGVVAVAFVPWVLAIFRFAEPASDVGQNIGWIQRPGIRALADLVFDLADPFYFQQSTIERSANFIIVIPLILLIGAALIAYLVKFREDENKDRTLFLATLILAPIVFAFALSWLLPVSIWGSRHLIIIFAPAIVLASIFAASIVAKPVKYALGAIGLFLVGTAFILQVLTAPPQLIWCAWEDLARNVQPDQPQTIYAFEDLVAYHLWFAARGEGNVRVVKTEGMPEVREDKAYFLPRGFTEVSREDAGAITGDRFWIAFRVTGSSDRHSPLRALTERGYLIVSRYSITAGRETAFLVELRRP